MSVYFARRDDLIKIGWSRNVLGRVAALKAKLIGVVPGGRIAEAAMHKRFEHLRVHGEWFRIDESLLTYIRNDAQEHAPDDESAQVGIRLPLSLVARLDDLAKSMTELGLHVFTRADVFRVAAIRGIDELETEKTPTRRKQTKEK